MTTSLILLLAACAGVAAFLYGRRTSRGDRARDAGPPQRTDQRIVELSRKLEAAEEELARKRAFTEQIPLLVSKLAQELPEGFLPPLAVRFARNYFCATQVGYFVPIEGAPDYTLEVGVGFRADWTGKVRIASDEGILGVAVQKKVVALKGDATTPSAAKSLGLSLEQSGVEPDFVAPVIGLSGIAGVLVLAGCPFPLEGERIHVSMLADLLSGALQKAALAELSKSSTWIDHLTGVANRLYFARRFESEIRRAQNYQQGLGLLMIDIDGFKAINDTYGHPAGDLVIKKFAEIVRNVTRSSDLVCRYGGDEFMVLVTSSNLQQVLAYADLLVRKIAAADILVPRHGAVIHLTASGGVAMYPANGQSSTELLHAADDALYEAKRQGRNRIVLAHSPERVGSIDNGEGTGQGEDGASECGIERKAGASLR